MTDREVIEAHLKLSLSNGGYARPFLDDIFKLWQEEEISPEVILREVRGLEGLDKPLMEIEGDEPVPVWIGDRETEYKRAPSAMKEASQFVKDNSPLRGLWHKHYFINREDFLAPNVKNHAAKYPQQSPIMAMMSRLIEGKITGEWIIFKMENGIRTYLCLAKHAASIEEDLAIARRIGLG
jgi:hypothetical protein